MIFQPEIQARVEQAKVEGYSAGKIDAENQYAAIMARDDLTRKQKLKLVRAEYKRIKKDLRKKRAELVIKKAALVVREVSSEITEWAEGELKLEKPQSSQFHQFQKDIDEGRYLQRRKEETPLSECIEAAQSFVVEHNWAAAFTNATDFESIAFRLPFDVCCFEFVISNRRVIVFASHTGEENDSDIVLKPLVRDPQGWLEADYIYRYCAGRWEAEKPSGVDCYASLATLIGGQIKAISVALDAQVATTEVIRAPHKLSLKREKAGMTPLKDYHIVTLTREPRAAALPEQEISEPHTRKRLHFRRGHWRHFTESKTWVRWCLVGDPDLGFIDKHYRL